jgi:flagellar motor switch protein FliM
MAEGKTLSQWEVDALLSAFNAEPKADAAQEQAARRRSTRPVKNYDFRRPDKFSKEQMRSLQLLHDTFARVLSTSLSTTLRGTISLHLTSVEQITYGEYSEQLPKPTVLYLLSLDPLPGRAVMEVNLPISFAIIDRLLGGPGDVVAPRQARQNSEMSDIEVTLLQSLADYFTGALRDAWSDILTLDPRVGDIVFSSELAQAALPNEICVLVIMEIKVLNNSGTLSLCLPYTLLEPIVGGLSAQALVAGSFKSGRREDPLARQRTLRQLERVSLPVSVGLGAASVSVNDILNLEVGDIICLDTPANGTLPMTVDGRARYRVRPGVTGARLAVRVDQVLPPDPDDDDQLALARNLLGGAHDGHDGRDRDRMESSHEQRIAV